MLKVSAGILPPPRMNRVIIRREFPGTCNLYKTRTQEAFSRFSAIFRCYSQDPLGFISSPADMWPVGVEIAVSKLKLL